MQKKNLHLDNKECALLVDDIEICPILTTFRIRIIAFYYSIIIVVVLPFHCQPVIANTGTITCSICQLSQEICECEIIENNQCRM